MPHMELSHRRQKAVLWAKGGYDGYGQPTAAEPVELSVRWVQRRAEMLDPQGNTITVDATVVVDREVAVGGVMWEGELEDWYDTGSAGQDSGLHRVAAYQETPDVKGRAVRRTVGLLRHRDTLPTIE